MKQGLLAIVLLLGLAFQASAQSTYVHLTITMNDGTEETYDMLSSSFMYFENGQNLVITEAADGMTTVTYPLANIRKITCDELVGTSENTDLDVAIYPNPTHNTLTIQNLKGKQLVKIYALDGRMMKSVQVSESQSINVSDLPAGLYLVNVSYHTFKMMKL